MQLSGRVPLVSVPSMEKRRRKRGKGKKKKKKNKHGDDSVVTQRQNSVT